MADAYISVDLGQLQDFTAITLIMVEYKEARIAVEGTEEPRFDPRDRVPVFEIPHLDRMQVPYREALYRIKNLSEHPSLMIRDVEIILDASGIGQAVLEMAWEMDLDITAVVITGGQEARFTQDKLYVPRMELITAAVVAYQARRIQIAPGLEYGPVLDEEMQNLKLKKRTTSTQDFIEAEVATQHDDMVMSLGMGIWRANQEHQRESIYLDRLEEEAQPLTDYNPKDWARKEHGYNPKDWIRGNHG